MLRIVLILLAVPVTACIGLSLLAGAHRWRHVAAFSLGSLLPYPMVGACLAIFASHQVHQVDELGLSTRDVLEIDLALAEIASVVAALALAAGFLFAERVLKSDVGRRHWTHSLLAGALTALLVELLLGQTVGDAPLLALVVLPVAYALVWFRKPGKRPAESDQKAA